MAKSKKKKPNSSELQRKALSNHRSSYIEKIKFILNSYADEDVFSFIPKDIIDVLYETRLHPFRLRVKENHIIEPQALKFFKEQIPNTLKVHCVNMNNSGNKLSILDSTVVGVSVLTLGVKLNTLVFPNSDKVLKAALAYTDDMAFHEEVNNLLTTSIVHITFGYSAFSERLYWVNRVPLDQTAGIDNYCVDLEILSSVASKTSISIDEVKRPVIELAWAYPGLGVEVLLMDPSVFKPFLPKQQFRFTFKSLFKSDSKLKVYMQSHALSRLEERVDSFWPGAIHFSVVNSLKLPVLLYEQGSLLAEYSIFGKKVGYLVLDIHQNYVLIRTFLFITNNGTPEGRKLEKITGLKKMDKKYLAIDRLSTFMESDICENAEMSKILKEAGCESLIGLYEFAKLIKGNDKESEMANYLLSYIEK